MLKILRPFTLGSILRNNLPKYFSNMDPLEAIHDPKNQKFYISFKNDEAVLDYNQIGSNAVELYHTEVPESLRGKGIAKILAKEALDHFASKDVKMKLTCWYLQKYYKENEKTYMKHIYE